MLSVATMVMIVSGIGFVEALNGIKRYTDSVVLFGAILTIMLSTMLGIVGLLWELQAFGMSQAPYILPPWPVLIEHIRTAYSIGR